jgi:hypothetical protein
VKAEITGEIPSDQRRPVPRTLASIHRVTAGSWDRRVPARLPGSAAIGEQDTPRPLARSTRPAGQFGLPGTTANQEKDRHTAA